jgi:hypothetical protein
MDRYYKTRWYGGDLYLDDQRKQEASSWPGKGLILIRPYAFHQHMWLSGLISGQDSNIPSGTPIDTPQIVGGVLLHEMMYWINVESKYIIKRRKITFHQNGIISRK